LVISGEVGIDKFSSEVRHRSKENDADEDYGVAQNCLSDTITIQTRGEALNVPTAEHINPLYISALSHDL
jgi:hypothetical protein